MAIDDDNVGDMAVINAGDFVGVVVVVNRRDVAIDEDDMGDVTVAVVDVVDMARRHRCRCRRHCCCQRG